MTTHIGHPDDTESASGSGTVIAILKRLRTLSGGGFPATLGQKAKAASLPVTLASDEDLLALTGAVTETAPVSDTASSGLNGRLQRVAQRLSSLIGLLPTALGQKAKAASLPVTLASDEDLLALTGAVTETAPANDTASSGLNGRLQRVAQRLSSLIGLLPTALGANGGLKVEGVAGGAAQPVTLGTEEVTLKRAASGTYAAAVSITNAATSIKAAVAARIRLELHHQGPDSAARVWLGADNTLTAGAAGKNFGYLDPGDTWESRDYTGAVYGRTEAGTALISYLEV